MRVALPDLPDDLGSHTIVDGELVFCAHPMYWPVVRYEFDLRNCEDCDVFKPSANRDDRPPARLTRRVECPARSSSCL